MCTVQYSTVHAHLSGCVRRHLEAELLLRHCHCLSFLVLSLDPLLPALLEAVLLLECATV